MKMSGGFDFRVPNAMARKAVMVGLLIGGEETLGVSNAQIPHEDGDLERTGAVTGDVDALKVAISYRDVAYPGQAVDQHENMTYHHDSGRNAKFLERALAQTRDRVRDAVAGQLRKAFKA